MPSCSNRPLPDKIIGVSISGTYNEADLVLDTCLVKGLADNSVVQRDNRTDSPRTESRYARDDTLTRHWGVSRWSLPETTLTSQCLSAPTPWKLQSVAYILME